MRKRSTRRLVGTVLAVSGLTMGVLGGAIASGAVTPKAGSTIAVALPPGSVPTSTFPFYSAAQCTTTNIDYWQLEVRPGYYFGLGKSVSLQPALGALNNPTIALSGANTTIDFSVKGWKWSNGASTRTMTAQDVAFFLNMDKAQTGPLAGANAFCGYAPGFGFPEQVLSVSYPGGLSGSTVHIVMKGHASKNWLIYNELSQIIPMTTAWDTTGGGPGSGGCSAEPFASVKPISGTKASPVEDNCSKVYDYLSNLQINDPLWAWSDGPYRQQSAEYSSGAPDGNDVQVCNTDYSGPVGCQAVKTVDYRPYADIAPEISDLQANKLSFGFVDTTDVTKSPGPGLAGSNTLPNMSNYKTEGGVTFGVFYWMFNFDDSHSTYQTKGSPPSWARLNGNQYFRAAMQWSDNQATVIAHVDNGYAVPTFSAIPTYPKNAFNAGIKNPYAYSKTKGKALMASHGWNVKKFPAVCAKSNCAAPGSPAIPKGTKAVEQVLVPSGVPSVTHLTLDEIASIKAGSDIQVVAKFEPATTVQGACFGGAAAWQLCGYGGWIYAPDFYPSGEVLFAAGSSSNSGGYVSHEMNALIASTTTNGNIALNGNNPKYHTSFGQFTATDEPFLWQPTPTTFGEQAKSIVGAQAPNPLGNFNPEYITAI
jgi:peptide/nickel transport system substrate-binding protein